MTLSEAQQNVSQVLDAERMAPTVTYLSPTPFTNQAAVAASALGQRGWHPRPVAETPGYFVLKSRNYELIHSFFDDVIPSDHASFFERLRERISEPNAFKTIGSDVLGAGKTSRTYSELPLISEFLVRRGDVGGFLEALSNAPLRPALTRLLVHIEEMIALDYRLFSDREYDELRSVVANIKSKLDELGRRPRVPDTLEANYRYHVCSEGVTLCESITEQCNKAKYLRLATQTSLRTSGRLEGIDALQPNQDDENFDKLAKQVRSLIENGTPELGLDRLHTFALKYIRTIYEHHFGRTPDRALTANSLLGEFANDLRQKGIIQSKMTAEILKSSTRVLDEFNHVRNNQTLAHDNAEIINREEAQFIYQSIAASVRFLSSLEGNHKPRS